MLLITNQLQVERCVWFKHSMDKSAYITIIRQSGRENAQHPDLLFIDTPRSHIGKEVCISNVLFGSSTHTHTSVCVLQVFPGLACGITLQEVLNTQGLQWMSPYQHHNHRWIIIILSHTHTRYFSTPIKSTLGTYSKPKHNVALRVTAVDVQAEALQMEVYWNMISHPMKWQRVVKRIQPKKNVGQKWKTTGEWPKGPFALSICPSAIVALGGFIRIYFFWEPWVGPLMITNLGSFKSFRT